MIWNLYSRSLHIPLYLLEAFWYSEQDWTKGREIMVQKWISKRFIMTFTFSLETWMKSLNTLYTKALFYLKPEKANGREIIVWTRIFLQRSDMTLTYKLCSRSLHILYQKAACDWSVNQIGPSSMHKWRGKQHYTCKHVN